MRCVGDDRREFVVVVVVGTVVLLHPSADRARSYERSSSGRALRLDQIRDAREGPPRDAADGLEAPPQRPGVSFLHVDADDAVSMGRGQFGWRGGPRFTDGRVRARVRDEASSGNRIATTGSDA